jgi:hypothetical protein
MAAKAALTHILTFSLTSWKDRSASTQKDVDCVLQPVCALETLPGLGSASWVLARSRSGTKDGRQGSIDPYSHLLPDILEASIGKHPEGCRLRSTARVRPGNTPWARQRVLGPLDLDQEPKVAAFDDNAV